jgi:hypothetical protein
MSEVHKLWAGRTEKHMDRKSMMERIAIALLFSENSSSYRALKLALHIGSDLDLGIKPVQDFDARILNNAHPEFQYEVVKNGPSVFSRNKQERCDFEAEVISAYLDLKEM